VSAFKYQLELSFLCCRIVLLLTSALSSVEVLSFESDLRAQNGRNVELMQK